MASICLAKDTVNGINDKEEHMRYSLSLLSPSLSLDRARITSNPSVTDKGRVAANPFSRKRIDDRPSEDPEEVRALKSERPV